VAFLVEIRLSCQSAEVEQPYPTPLSRGAIQPSGDEIRHAGGRNSWLTAA